MPPRKIQVGQVWTMDDTSDAYLVTKIYNEALTTFAVLRKTRAEDEAPLRIKVERVGATQTLHGFSFAQESSDL